MASLEFELVMGQWSLFASNIIGQSITVHVIVISHSVIIVLLRYAKFIFVISMFFCTFSSIICLIFWLGIVKSVGMWKTGPLYAAPPEVNVRNYCCK